MSKMLLCPSILTAVAIASILVSCAGPQPASAVPTSTSPPPTSTPPPPTATAAEPYTVVVDSGPIIGTWKYSSSDFTRFDPDGTYREARSLEALEDNPFAIGQYDFEENRLVVQQISVSGVPSCGSKLGVYEVHILADGQMEIVLIEEGCPPRGRDTEGNYERIP